MISYYEEIAKQITEKSQENKQEAEKYIEQISLASSRSRERTLEKCQVDTSNDNLEKGHIRMFHSYSGADAVFYIDGKSYGEIQSINWYNPSEIFSDQLYHSDYHDKNLAMERPVVVVIELSVFEEDILPRLKNAEIAINYASEYGSTSSRKIEGVAKLYEISGTSLDQLVMSTYIVAAAKNVTPLVKGLVKFNN